MYQSPEQGGLSVSDISQLYASLGAMWAKRMINKNVKWVQLLQDHIGIFNLTDILRASYSTSMLDVFRLSDFYLSVFEEYVRFRSSQVVDNAATVTKY